MSATLSRRGVLLLAPLLLLPSRGAAAAQEAAPPRLDLARMMLTAADLGATAWGGLEPVPGRTISVVDLADRAVWPAGAGAEQDAIRDDLLAAGWQQGYAAGFTSPWDVDRPDPGRQVEIEIGAYADSAGAARGFARIPDVYATGPAEVVADAPRIGDESRLVRVAARDPQAGVPSQELALGFRHDHLTAHILLRDWSGEPPAAPIAEDLASRLLARIAQELDAQQRA